MTKLNVSLLTSILPFLFIHLLHPFEPGRRTKFGKKLGTKLGAMSWLRHFWRTVAVLIFSILGVSGGVCAAKSTESTLYEIKLPAPEQNSPSQAALIQQAFKEVLVRLSGSEKILSSPAITKALNEVDNYVSLFGYQLASDQQRVFRVRFDDVLMNQLIENTGQAVLDVKRPTVVVWLTTKQNDHTEWVGGEFQHELSSELEAMAKKRGLALVMPLLDLTDTAIVTEQKVWNEEFQAIEAASKRYNAEQILIGRLTKQPSGWYGQWTYVKEGQPLRWELSHADPSQLLKEALEGCVVRMSSSQVNANEGGDTGAVVGALQDKQVRLVVLGISGVDQYAKVMRYLKGINHIESVEVDEISPEQTIFKINTRNGRAPLVKTLAHGKILIDPNTVVEVKHDEFASYPPAMNDEPKTKTSLPEPDLTNIPEVLTYKIAEVF